MMRGALVISVAAAMCAAGAQAQQPPGAPRDAAAFYERQLMRTPDDDAARLAYVEVLLRLDERDRAAREIAKLEPLMLPPEQVERLDALRLRLGGEAR
jgi:hypothetical protein